MYGSRRERTPLFWTGDGADAMRRQIRSAMAEADALPEARVLDTDETALMDYFEEKYWVDIPSFDRNDLSGTHEERQVEARDPWNDHVSAVSGEAYSWAPPLTLARSGGR